MKDITHIIGLIRVNDGKIDWEYLKRELERLLEACGFRAIDHKCVVIFDSKSARSRATSCKRFKSPSCVRIKASESSKNFVAVLKS